jgi:hypothetical protein
VHTYPWANVQPENVTLPHSSKQSDIYRIVTDPAGYTREPATGSWQFGSWMIAQR